MNSDQDYTFVPFLAIYMAVGLVVGTIGLYGGINPFLIVVGSAVTGFAVATAILWIRG